MFQVLLWCTACCRIVSAQDEERGAFHYSSFRGPVAGEAEEISIPISGHRDGDSPYEERAYTWDYVAKPEYSFVYGVEDPQFGKSHKHEETRDGDVVKGEYSLVEPDGSIRRVVYTSDAEHGFQATVTRIPPKKGWSLPRQPPLSELHQVIPEMNHVSQLDEESTPTFSPEPGKTGFGSFDDDRPDEFGERDDGEFDDEPSEFNPSPPQPQPQERPKSRYRY